MSKLPSAQPSASAQEDDQEASSIDTLLTNVHLFSNQLHSLMDMLSGFRKHLYHSHGKQENKCFRFPPHVNLEIAQVLRKYNANRLSDVMFKIQKEINKLLIDVRMLNSSDDFSKYDLLSVLKNLEEGFGKVYHMQKIMEDVEENALRQIDALHE